MHIFSSLHHQPQTEFIKPNFHCEKSIEATLLSVTSCTSRIRENQSQASVQGQELGAGPSVLCVFR